MGRPDKFTGKEMWYSAISILFGGYLMTVTDNYLTVILMTIVVLCFDLAWNTILERIALGPKEPKSREAVYGLEAIEARRKMVEARHRATMIYQECLWESNVERRKELMRLHDVESAKLEALELSVFGPPRS